jgi:hypothetical protein
MESEKLSYYLLRNETGKKEAKNFIFCAKKRNGGFKAKNWKGKEAKKIFAFLRFQNQKGFGHFSSKRKIFGCETGAS